MMRCRVLVAMFAALVCSVLGGCASRPASGPSLYLLYADSPTVDSIDSDRPASRIVVAPVDLAPVLDRDGIVYQTAEHRVVFARDHRWAAPLGRQLRDRVIDQLRQALPDANVVRVGEPDADRDAAIRVTPRIERFMGHFDGHARIAGTWEIQGLGPEGPSNQTFSHRLPLAHDGYDALVATLAEGWTAESRALADRLALHRNTP